MLDLPNLVDLVPESTLRMCAIGAKLVIERCVMNYSEVRKALMIALRGKRSFQTLAQRLGVSRKVLWSWETGSRGPTWEEFKLLTRIYGVSLNQVCTSILGKKINSSADLLDAFLKTEFRIELAKSAGLSRFRIQRLQNKKQDLRLDEVLLLMDRCVFQLPEFLSTLLKEGATPPLIQEIILGVRAKKYLFKNTEAQLILFILKLQQYRQQPSPRLQWLAITSGLAKKKTLEILTELLELGIIRERETDFYEATQLFSDASGINQNEFWKNNRVYWIEKGLQRLQKMTVPPQSGAMDSLFGYHAFNANPKLMDEIREEYSKFYSRISALIEDHSHTKSLEGPSFVRIFNFQCFDPLEEANELGVLPKE